MQPSEHYRSLRGRITELVQGLSDEQLATVVPGCPQWSVRDLVSHLSALAADVLSRAPERFAVAGLSMGGYCALEILRQAPERVVALALVDSSARPDTPESKANREKQIDRARTAYPALVDEVLPKWIHPSRLHEAEVGGVARDMALDAGRKTFAWQQRAIMSRADSRPLLKAIACPTVVVCGAEDALIPMEVHEELARGIAGARLEVIPACGHLAPLERPNEVADALRTWMRQLA